MPRQEISSDRDRLIHFRLSQDIHKRLRIFAAQEGSSMQAVVNRAIQRELDVRAKIT